mmetsp:Transcript_349/g.725  ORF Transcript_349/g.725 Transcript_349/m.725 type:complete len:106 (+) Transcript_349:113-430(+)
MVFNLLFASRILPKAMQPARGIRAEVQNFARASVRLSSTSMVSPSTQALALAGPPSASSPRVVARPFHRNPSINGPIGWLVWLVGWTTCAGFVQDFAGPYIFFHE